MAQLSITQLPIAGAITGTEPVPIVQNGVTVQTTTGAISGAGALNYPFLTVGTTAGLAQARYIATNAGLSLTDNGAGNTLQLNLIGAAMSLNSSGNGIQVKTGLSTVTNVSLAAGTGLSATNADGTTGNPTISLGAALQQFVSLTGTGMLAIQNGLTAKVDILGTTSQISILNGNGAGNVTVGIADDPIFPGTGSATLPNGTTGQRLGSFGAIRYNTSLSQFEGYTNTGWNQFSVAAVGVTSFSAGTTGFSPNTSTTGAVTLSGTLNVANGGTGGTATPTAGTIAYGNGTAYAFTAAGNSGQVLTSAGAGTPTWTTPTTGTVTSITAGTGLSGGTITSTGTIAIDSTVATLTGTQTFTNKTISGASNTLTSIANASLTNSSVTVGTTAIALGASSLTLGGLTTVTVTQDPTAALDLATKQYVDAVAQGLDPKASCVAATTVNITLSGTQTIDGVALIAGDRCLVKDQTAPAENGIYLVASGAWTRTTDMDVWAEVPGAFTFIEQGTTQADTGWVCTSNAGGTIGTTAITFVQFAGVGSYTAGTGLTLTGTQFSLTSPVAVSLGGTGSTTAFTQYGVAYGSTTSAMATTAAGTTTTVLHGNASGAPTFGAVSLTADVSGTLPIANGGTNSTATATAGGAAYGTGTAFAFTAAGTAGQVLTSAGASAPVWSGIAGGTF